GGVGPPATVVPALIDAFYPRLTLGPGGALLHWNELEGSGYVVLDRDGRPAGAVHERPDFKGNGKAALIASACALPDGRYVLFSAAERVYDLSPTRAIATLLGADGAVITSRDLGPLDSDAR